MHLTTLLLALLVGCSSSDSGRGTSLEPGSVLGPDFFIEPGYDGTPIDGMILYSIIGNGDGSEDPPYIVGLLDQTERYFSNTTGLRDQCVVNPSPLTVDGTRDVGSAMTMGVGANSYRMARQETFDYDVAYIFDTLPALGGRRAGEELRLDGFRTGVHVPASIDVVDDQLTLERVAKTGALELRWEPSSGEYPRLMMFIFASWNAPRSSATEKQVTYCQFIDDGVAEFDLSSVVKPDWPHHEARFGRTTRAYIDHPDHGSLFVNTKRDYRRVYLDE